MLLNMLTYGYKYLLSLFEYNTRMQTCYEPLQNDLLAKAKDSGYILFITAAVSVSGDCAKALNKRTSRVDCANAIRLHIRVHDPEVIE